MHTKPMPCVPHAVAIRELTRITAADPSVVNLVNLAQFCAAAPVVEAVARAAAMVRGEADDDPWLDHVARETVTAAVRACGVLNTAPASREFVVLNEVANLEAAMEPYVDGVLLADEAVWSELTALDLFPECGGAWWCVAYADRLATAS